ncbi:alpha/beta hydrolase [Romboutsia hominis]|uniref:alpha/beta hydrolase n=1 Tax=Romboutsia hominis TaxID=1507512 RepID=UPI001F06C1E8|nr:alpha/beta hydrolase [Romboutsia hominis]MCH1959216.1 alpha/beta hydrolase [Romboutsia hominis]MCH1970115.1 alpha/beta hydrolase [Romboutsia hominis]
MKKTSKKKVLFIAIIMVLSLLGGSYYLGKLVYDGSVGSSEVNKSENIVEVFSQKPDKPLDKLKNYKHENLMIKTKNNYKIESLLIKSNKKTNNTIVMVHGIGRSYYDMLRYSFNYLDNGYNVLVYNQRHTGKSGGDDYSFGLYERYDLDSAVKYIKKIYPDGKIGVHGFSMGAATSTMHVALNEKDKNVDFYILDSPYSKMEDAVRLGIEAENIPLIPTSYISFWGDIYTKLHSGFNFDDVMPYKAVENSTVPIMLIHEKGDKVCASDNSEEIYKSIPHNKKELWIIDGNNHIGGYDDTGNEYFFRIFKFIDKYAK